LDCKRKVQENSRNLSRFRLKRLFEFQMPV
jgi:hypothetical protein